MAPEYTIASEADAVNLVDVRIIFSSSSSPNASWFFNSKKIDFSDVTKYHEFCTHETPLKHSCTIQIFTYSEVDAGFYTLELSLVEYNIKNSINFTLIAPKKPELTISRVKDCSLNYTCEFGKEIQFTCRASAHDIDSILTFQTPCKNLDDCYQLQKDTQKIFILIDDFRNNNPDQELTSVQQPQISHSVGFKADQPYLIICNSQNNLGETTRSVIMIPSDIKQGQTSTIKYINFERDSDIEVVEGDSFAIQFDFVHQLFDVKSLKFVKPHIQCEYTISYNETEYTYSQILTFKNVTQMCTHVYTFDVASKKHPYLNERVRRNSWNITVQKPVAPEFIYPFNLTSNNQTVKFSQISENNYEIVIDGYQSLTLDCIANAWCAKPRINITWFKSGSKLKEFENMYEIIIWRTHSSDSGLYECLVKNRIGTKKRAFNVEVLSTVIISKKLSDKQKAAIGFIIAVACILLILLVIAIGYVILQRRKNAALKVCVLFLYTT